ncbi:MAG: hypothetical protein R8K54_07815 [Mariprofundaceae bacterium]
MSLSKKHLKYLALLSLTLFVTICLVMFSHSGINKIGVSQVIDARDRAISNQSIPEYSSLISTTYNDHGRDKIQIVAQMVSLFDRFERAEMHSYDRQIRQLSDIQAQCDQSYTLKVFADGEWRQIVQREQLTLTRGASGWKISAGL